MTEGQKAALALDLLPHLEQQARERQSTSSGGSKPQLVERIPHPDDGEAIAHPLLEFARQ
jgi:hypothetical protein